MQDENPYRSPAAGDASPPPPRKPTNWFLVLVVAPLLTVLGYVIAKALVKAILS